MKALHIYWKERKAKLSPEINSKLDDQPPSQSDFCIKFPEIIKRRGVNY